MMTQYIGKWHEQEFNAAQGLWYKGVVTSPAVARPLIRVHPALSDPARNTLYMMAPSASSE